VIKDLVSIIIPVYNLEQYIDKAVMSALNQKYQSIEIILVDDGSTDSTPEICDKYEFDYDNVTAEHIKHGGVCVARNRGLEVSKGEYIYFLDGDDYIRDDLIEDNINIMKKGYDSVAFNYLEVNAKGRVLYKSQFPEAEYRFVLEKEKYNHFFKVFFQNKVGWMACNRLLSAHIIKKNHLYFIQNERNYGEDLLFMLEYTLHSKNIYCNKKPYYYYLQRSNSTMGKRGKECYLDTALSNILCFQRYCGEKQFFGLGKSMYLFVLYIILIEICNRNQREIKDGIISLKKGYRMYMYHYLGFCLLHPVKVYHAMGKAQKEMIHNLPLSIIFAELERIKNSWVKKHV